MITPVWIPGINDEDIESIIKFVKEAGCRIGLQKYEEYKYSRKMKKAKYITYWKFYKKIKEWEDKFKIPLIIKKEDLHVERRPRLKTAFELGEKVNTLIKCDGWLPGQKIGVAKNVCISINNCGVEKGKMAKVKITENKNNIYIGEMR